LCSGRDRLRFVGGVHREGGIAVTAGNLQAKAVCLRLLLGISQSLGFGASYLSNHKVSWLDLVQGGQIAFMFPPRCLSASVEVEFGGRNRSNDHISADWLQLR